MEKLLKFLSTAIPSAIAIIIAIIQASDDSEEI